jgi:hypothetical protein
VDFAREIEDIGAFLDGAGVPHAVVGGVALAGYGHPRMTLDLDLVTDIAAQDALVAFMESHLHPDRRHGRVDVVYVRGETARRLFDDLRSVPGPGGRFIKVPKPEHLIAMKVQAMRDAPERARGRSWWTSATWCRSMASTATRFAATSRRTACWSDGMSSNEPGNRAWLDLARDLPTTAEDVRVLRALREQAPSWLQLTVEEFEALVPPGALERRTPTPPGCRPFTLE